MSNTEETIVRGYHACKEIWDAAIWQVLSCQQESGNIHDPYTVAIVKRGVIVGHVPWGVSLVCYFFLGRNGTLTCQVTDTRHYSIDLPQGGLEIPCKLIFFCESRLMVKVQNFLQEALTSGLLTSCNMDSETQKKKEPTLAAQVEVQNWTRWFREPGEVRRKWAFTVWQGAIAWWKMAQWQNTNPF